MTMPAPNPRRTPAPRTPRDVRCAACERLLAKMDPGALRPGAELEIKCGRCNHYNLRRGDDLTRPPTH